MPRLAIDRLGASSLAVGFVFSATLAIMMHFVVHPPDGQRSTIIFVCLLLPFLLPAFRWPTDRVRMGRKPRVLLIGLIGLSWALLLPLSFVLTGAIQNWIARIVFSLPAIHFALGVLTWVLLAPIAWMRLWRGEGHPPAAEPNAEAIPPESIH